MNRVVWPIQVHSALNDIIQSAKKNTGTTPSQADAQRILFSSNSHTSDRLGWSQADRDSVVREARNQVRSAGYNPLAAEPLIHYAHLRKILEGVTSGGQGNQGNAAKIDRVLLHRVLGPILFTGIMLGLFASVFWLAKFPMQWIQAGVDWIKIGVAPF
jgi:ferrous iron transport protein B